MKRERDSTKTLCTDSEGGGDGGSVTASRSTHNHRISPVGQRAGEEFTAQQLPPETTRATPALTLIFPKM
jgi:hypothetical protein